MRWPWFTRSQEADLDDELQSHLRIAIQERIEAGEDPAAARAHALEEFGNVTRTREATRTVWRGPVGDALVDVAQDLRYAWRSLRRNHGYALAIVLVLGLGVGAATAVFTLFKAAFLQPLPGVDGAARLVGVFGRASDGRSVTVSYPDYRDVRARATSLSGLVASSPLPLNVGRGENARRVWSELVSGNYFDVLGVGARLGRTLRASDESPAAEAVAVISDGLWHRAFDADPKVLGSTIWINGQPVTVVGVAEPGFRGSMVSLVYDLFVPLTLQPRLGGESMLEARGTRWLILTGRLAGGASLEAAEAEMQVLAAQLARSDPSPDLAARVHAVPLWRSPFGAQTFLLPVVAALAAASLLVLTIVCTNLANLALARGLTRSGEISVRRALGASRARIVRLILIENAMLAVPAAALGLLLATRDFSMGAGSNVASVAPTELDMHTDWWVIGCALLVACLSTLVFSLVPALRASRVPVASMLKEEGRTTGAGRARLRGALVVAQVAASLVLLVGAALTQRTVRAARDADIGFDPADTVSIAIDLQPGGYDEARGQLFYDQLLEQLRATPGVTAAAAAAFVPLRMIEATSRTVKPDGYNPGAGEDMRLAFNTVSSGYFGAMRIALAAGREFDDTDSSRSVPVVIVNETMARRYWGAPEAAIGKRVRMGAGERWFSVVGVARDIKYLSINEAPAPYFYLPLGQNYRSDVTIHVRGTLPSAAIVDAARTRLRELDPNLPVLDVQTLAAQAQTGTLLYATVAATLAAFGVMAVGLAGVGLFGLVSYTVRQREQEIGVRVALGAGRADLLRQFLWSGLRLGAAGAAAGTALAYMVTRLMTGLLYGVSPTDPASFGLALLVVLGLTTVAAAAPAWRAANVDPTVTLRRP